MPISAPLRQDQREEGLALEASRATAAAASASVCIAVVAAYVVDPCGSPALSAAPRYKLLKYCDLLLD